MPPRRPGKISIDLDKIQDVPAAPVEADSNTIKEESDLAGQHHKAEIEGIIQDIAERKKYASRIFCLVSIWLFGMFVLLILQGFFSPHRLFELSEKVLIAAIGGTTLNIIGIFIVVARYLFPSTAAQHKKFKGS